MSAPPTTAISLERLHTLRFHGGQDSHPALGAAGPARPEGRRLALRSLERRGLTVTALIFDGCHVRHEAGVDLEAAMRQAEADVADEVGYHIELCEKPLQIPLRPGGDDYLGPCSRLGPAVDEARRRGRTASWRAR